MDVLVDSAGISDEEHGNPIDPRAARVLREAGHRVPDHRARQVSAAELDSWDLVLAMTRQHLRALERLAERVGAEVHSWVQRAARETPRPTRHGTSPPTGTCPTRGTAVTRTSWRRCISSRGCSRAPRGTVPPPSSPRRPRAAG
ncbi:arsenate reductase/protein-tyrosine-phosphatase family protein [Microbacterium lacticum]